MPTSPRQTLVVLSDRESISDIDSLLGHVDILNVAIGIEGGSFRVSTSLHTQTDIETQQPRHFLRNQEAMLGIHLLTQLRHAAGGGAVLLRFDPNLLPLFQRAVFEAELPFVFWADQPVVLNWKQNHVLAAARARILTDDELRSDWKSRYVYDVTIDETGDHLLGALTAVLDHPDPNPSPSETDARKVLIISYFTPPAETVAVHRIAYWQSLLPEIAAENGQALEATVLTAIGDAEPRPNTLFVPDRGDIEATQTARDLTKRIDGARVNSFASYWSDHIRKFFKANPGYHFDAVVMSGNPFYYFDLAEDAKRMWNAEVVLDFRDPFAHNPRFVYTPPHAELVQSLEDEYLAHADHALSVNSVCLEAIRLDDPDKGEVVANGYDERVVESVGAIPQREEDDRIAFVYSGTFFHDRRPDQFLAALDPLQHKLIHIGRSREDDAHLDDYPSLRRYGLMPYEDVVGYCRSMDAGIIFTSGAAFEQTTKIFDYIATDIDIVIVTDGEPYTGELHHLTKGLEGVYWVRNEPNAIAEFIRTYRPEPRKRPNRSDYCRRAQTEKLYRLIA